MRTVRVPLIYGRFNELGDMSHNYLRAVDIMARVDGPNWHNKSFSDLEDEDFIWGVSMIASKRMGLRCGAQVDEYPLFNQLMYMALNDAMSEYLSCSSTMIVLTSLDRSRSRFVDSPAGRQGLNVYCRDRPLPGGPSSQKDPPGSQGTGEGRAPPRQEYQPDDDPPQQAGGGKVGDRPIPEAIRGGPSMGRSDRLFGVVPFSGCSRRQYCRPSLPDR